MVHKLSLAISIAVIMVIMVIVVIMAIRSGHIQMVEIPKVNLLKTRLVAVVLIFRQSAGRKRSRCPRGMQRIVGGDG